MDIRQIQKFLPHRYPMLLVDRILELELGKRARGYKNVSANEAFFVGHYPGMPVMPGVLILESMAQVGSVILLADERYEGYTPLVAGFDNVKFKRPVFPGDRLDTEVEALWFRKQMGALKAVATVDGEIACTAEILYKVLSDGETL